jgi:type IV fimbrial biogenesis protein FimT
LVVLLIAAVLLTAGIPAVGWLILDAQRTADINALVTSIQLARSESAKRHRPVVLCKTSDWRTCGGQSVHYEGGWMVFVDEAEDSPPVADASERVLFNYQPRSSGTIRSNRSQYVFRPFYRRSTNGTITFCDRRGLQAARAVIVSYTGRPRVSDRGPGGAGLACAK